MKTHWRVAIIGAGFGGLGMARRLKQAGMGTDDFVVFEKGQQVGGIWYWNTYPGCDSDVPGHVYTFSWDPYLNSKVRYPKQQEILSYLCGVADKFGIRPHLRLGTTITGVIWDDHRLLWTLTTAAGQVQTADVVIFAVGQLHRPHTPELTGAECFGGAAFHTAQWRNDMDLAGRNIAVIGTGSSAAQMIPRVAQAAGSVTVYQRTPAWVLPKPADEFGALTQALLRTFPVLHRVYRAATWLGADVVLTPVIRGGWSARLVERVARLHLRRQVPDPELRRQLTPDYAIGCKRILVNSDFYPALGRSNVELVTAPIRRITATGIETTDERNRAADLIIYATGFKTSEFVPVTVRGRNAIDLHEQWVGGAEAYLGMAPPPGFPNMWFIHGPNTILGTNSNVFMIEQQVRYVTECLKKMVWNSDDKRTAVEVKPEAMDAYRRWLAETLGGTVLYGCQSWYQTQTPNGHRVVTNPWPKSTHSYRRATRRDTTDAYREVAARPFYRLVSDKR